MGISRNFRQEFSVYVRNLPKEIDRYGLRGVFQKVGRVYDTYIPDKQSWRNQGRFGFVRYRTIQEAHACIHRFNGTKIRWNTIKVAMARPKKTQQRHGNHGRYRPTMQWQVRRVNNNGETPGAEASQKREQPCVVNLSGEKTDNTEWLTRTLVCTTVEARDLATLTSAINSNIGQFIKVTALSCHKFLLTFHTLEELEEAITNQAELEQWFVEIKRWGMEEVCDSRRVWLYIMGVPPHGWSRENFKRIAELWGEFISLDRSVDCTDSFEVMKVLVATKTFKFIEGEVILSIEYGGYRVFIREAGTVSQVRSPPLQRIMSNMEDNDSNQEVPGFEDLADMEESNSNQQPWKEQAEGKSKGGDSPLSNSNSNSKAIGNTGINYGGLKDDSNSKTKTVSFSQNGLSEELLKVSQKPRLAAKVTAEDQGVEVQAPPGFGNRKSNDEVGSIISKPNSKDKLDCVLSTDMGADINSQNSLDEPPGFEKLKEKGRNRLKTKPTHSRTGTTKQLEASTSSSYTNETTESMLKAAHESIQVGELLGVRVIGNKKEAIARITDHLKQRKVQERKSHPKN